MCEWPASTLGEDGNLGSQIHGRHVVRARLAFAVETRGGGAHTDDTVGFDQQSIHRKARKHVDAESLGLLSQPAHDLADRGQVVTVVPHGGGRGDPDRLVLRKEVDRLLADPAPERKITDVEFRKELV